MLTNAKVPVLWSVRESLNYRGTIDQSIGKMLFFLAGRQQLNSPAPLGILSQTYICKTQPGMLSAVSSVFLFIVTSIRESNIASSSTWFVLILYASTAGLKNSNVLNASINLYPQLFFWFCPIIMINCIVKFVLTIASIAVAWRELNALVVRGDDVDVRR